MIKPADSRVSVGIWLPLGNGTTSACRSALRPYHMIPYHHIMLYNPAPEGHPIGVEVTRGVSVLSPLTNAMTMMLSHSV